MQANLIFFKKNGIRKNIPLRQGTTILGRRPDCDIRVPTPYVSRKHARIVCDEVKALIQDLGSANGTFINNRQVIEAPVNAGDTISIGSSVFTVQIDGEPPEPNPPELSSPLQESEVSQETPSSEQSDHSETLSENQEKNSPSVTQEPEIDALANLEIISDDKSFQNKPLGDN